MKFRFAVAILSASVVSLLNPLTSSAAFVIDGLLDAGYGAPKATVSFDPLAPTSNFGTPGSTNHAAGYSIYLAADSTNVYGFLKADRDVDSLAFANLYFATVVPGGSNLGFEVTNNRAFVPGSPGYYGPPVPGLQFASETFATNGTGTTLEFTVPWTFFVNDPLGIGFTKIDASNNQLQLRLSQSFGFSVAGGASYGNDRLGVVTYRPAPNVVPEPTSLTLMALGGLCAAGVRSLRRRTAPEVVS